MINNPREEDIRRLCQGVLNIGTDFWDNPNGGYEYRCPFCHEMQYGGGFLSKGVDITEIKHDNDCIFLIAKDLMTNIKI